MTVPIAVRSPRPLSTIAYLDATTRAEYSLWYRIVQLGRHLLDRAHELLRLIRLTNTRCISCGRAAPARLGASIDESRCGSLPMTATVTFTPLGYSSLHRH